MLTANTLARTIVAVREWRGKVSRARQGRPEAASPSLSPPPPSSVGSDGPPPPPLHDPVRVPAQNIPERRQDVLPPVAPPGAADPQAAEPSAVVQPLHVHGLLPAQLPAGEEALHHLRLGLPRRPLPHLLQLLGKLLPLPLPGHRAARRHPRPHHCRHLGAEGGGLTGRPCCEEGAGRPSGTC